MSLLAGVLRQSVTIAGFVFVMMLIIEYLNVRTSGAWQERLARRRFGQYLLAAALGALPGCLGAFAVVALYSHRVVTVGALVAAMVATAGDESFFMLALVPRAALVIHGVLLVVAVAVGVLVDFLGGARMTERLACCEGFELHRPEACECFPGKKVILEQLRHCSAARGTLALMLVALLALVAGGAVGPPEWNWLRITVVAAAATSLFIVLTVPDHFLEEHLWRHVVMRHLPRVFMWTFGALLAMNVLVHHLDLEHAIQGGSWAMLLVACAVGLIPQSGPHLVFVTLYARGLVPFSVLLAGSIVQDGHGMLPLLAHSRRAFLVVKAVNFAAGAAVGAALMAAGM